MFLSSLFILFDLLTNFKLDIKLVKKFIFKILKINVFILVKYKNNVLIIFNKIGIKKL
jgi:hypothetical protein